MKIAVIGQSMFGAETYGILRRNGHEIVGVFTIPDAAGKQDPLGILFSLSEKYGELNIVILMNLYFCIS